MDGFDRVYRLAAFLTAFGLLWHGVRLVWGLSPHFCCGWMR